MQKERSINMLVEGSTLTLPKINTLTSTPGGGRMLFDDGGCYFGDYIEGKAHGHGICTGPKNKNQYSGSWNFGFEMSGVYEWPNGHIYEGRWQNGERHGVGVEYQGRWIYKGEYSKGLKGRYGVKMSPRTAVKYEGTWANGLQDGYGMEIYIDGGYYQGQLQRARRHGYGIRKSAPYGESSLMNPNKSSNIGQPLLGSSTSSRSKMIIHSNSLQSASMESQEEVDESNNENNIRNNSSNTTDPNDEEFKPIKRSWHKNGFVLVAKPLDVPIASQLALGDSKSGGNKPSSLMRIPGGVGSGQSTSGQTVGSSSLFKVNLLKKRLRRQKSTSDLDTHHNHHHNSLHHPDDPAELNPLMALSPEELDITDPSTVETYAGEWKEDKRNGHGVCERTDGLKYEGQWCNDKKNGYGVTTFKDGTKEEGKYRNNLLILDAKAKRYFKFGQANIKQKVEEAVKTANHAKAMAIKKAEIADTRAATARDKADQAMTAAVEAQRDSEIAIEKARYWAETTGHTDNPVYQRLVQPPKFGPESLQLRPMSHLQHHQQQQHQSYHHHPQQHQQQHQHSYALNPNGYQQAEGQDLGVVQYFNGRRGSFKAGPPGPAPVNVQLLNSTSGGGPGGLNAAASGSSGTRNTVSKKPSFAQGSRVGQSGYPTPVGSRQSPASAYPLSEQFDHYKSTGSSPSLRTLGKQASLDYGQLRAGSVGPGGSQISGPQGDPTGRLRRFRMSSLDHADENQRRQQQQQQTGETQQQVDFNQFQQLVTSGEDLQQQRQQDQANQKTNEHNQNEQFDSTNNQQQQQQHQTGDSQLAHSTPAGSSFNHSANSSYLGRIQTPSPESQNSAFRPSSSQYYMQQQQQQILSNQQYMPTGYMQNQDGQQFSTGYLQQQHQQYTGGYLNQQHYNDMMIKQRDVQSLADEQLYGYQQQGGNRWPGVDRSEYANYDFTITSLPRTSQRFMRRTASLSRGSPTGRKTVSRALSGASLALASGLQSRSQSPFASRRRLADVDLQRPTFVLSNAANQTSSQQANSNFPTTTNSTPGRPASILNQPPDDYYASNNIAGEHSDALEAARGLGAELTGSSNNLLFRKPSLQVRYDPIELGGLMSREEVAALSHAQREQKRIEAELRERRAKQPVLHLYLTFKDFLNRHQLILCVLAINTLMVKLFADLVT